MSERKIPFHNPFGALAPLGSGTPEAAAADEAPRQDGAREPAAAGRGAATIARAVIRIERAGRGGKDVTVVDHLDLPPAELAIWLKALKTGLGCGGAIEDASIVLQGDQRHRLPALLTARGVKKIARG